METVSCPLCDNAYFHPYFEQQGNDEYKALVGLESESSKWVKCESCEFIYHQPQFTQEELLALYDKFRDYTIRSETPDEYFDRITAYAPEKSENYQKVQWIIKNLTSCAKTKELHSIFDIGCGGGVFLWTVKELLSPKRMVGLEPTESFAKLAADRLNIQVFNEVYGNPVKLYGTHDLITVNQVLEHVKNPKCFIINLKENLLQAGFVYIEVPCAIDFSFLEPSHDRFKAQHLCYFSEDSLVNLFKNTGFKCISIETVSTLRGRNNIQAIFAKI